MTYQQIIIKNKGLREDQDRVAVASSLSAQIFKMKDMLYEVKRYSSLYLLQIQICSLRCKSTCCMASTTYRHSLASSFRDQWMPMAHRSIKHEDHYQIRLELPWNFRLRGNPSLVLQPAACCPIFAICFICSIWCICYIISNQTRRLLVCEWSAISLWLGG